MNETTDSQPPQSIPAENKYPIGRKPRGLSIVACRVGVATLLLGVVVASLFFGMRLRRWTWERTADIHFYPDMHNGIHWGGEAGRPAGRPRGFLNVYDSVASTKELTELEQPNYGLDYAPLRLLVMTQWVKWAKHDFTPQITQSGLLRDIHPDGAFDATAAMYAPLLRFNEAMEMVGAAGLFLLTRHWVIRGDKRIGSTSRGGTTGAILRPFRGSFAGLLSMLLFWFSPAVIVSTHGWPTWDEWVIPFFVWAVYLACTEWWFCAGLVIAIGAMFKGQQLFVAPLFVLWPLLLGQWESAMRWLAGLTLAIALIASPWLFSYVPGGATQLSAAADRRVDVGSLALAIAFAVFVVAAPLLWMLVQRRRGEVEPRNLMNVPRYRIGAALLVAIVIFACAWLFHGSFSWMVVGWGYGTRHYLHMTVGVSDNLAGLLNRRFGWGQRVTGGSELQEVVMTFAAHPLRLWPTHAIWFGQPIDITIRTLLVSIYLVTFLLLVVALAIQSRRNDPHFLVAITGVWVMFFTLMPQIHERYLLYAAGVGCSLTATGLGMAMLDVFMTLLTFVMTMHVMLDTARGPRLREWGSDVSNTFGASCLHFCRATFPDAGWAVLLTAAIFLYFAFRKSPVRVRMAAMPAVLPALITAENSAQESAQRSGEEIRGSAQQYDRQLGDAAGGGV